MAIEVYEVHEGTSRPVDVPSRDAPPGAGGQADESGASQTDAHGATDQSPAGTGQPSDSPPETPPASSGEGDADTDDDEPLRDDSEVNAERLNRRFARLTAARRKAERERDALAQQHQVELAQTRGQLEMVQRLLQGAAPQLPDTPAQPAGPPQAEQYASHEDYVLAAARYGAQQELQARDQQTAQERQQAQQLQFQQQLMQREQDFKAQHPDFDTVVRGGLAGKVSPVLQQALMLVPDGPAVAYTLARQPELVQRLNTLPPPLVLVELGRLLPPPQTASPIPAVGSTTGTPPPALPTPLTPLSGSGAGAPTGQFRDDMTQAEYRAWRARTSQLPKWKTG